MEQYRAACHRQHPVLQRLAHKRLWRYFAEDYQQSRTAFRSLARRQGLALRSEALPSSLGLDLTLDVAVRPGAAGTLLHLAGMRGVDGFVGAAVQRCLLRHLPQLLPPEVGLVLVHCVNPFGMAAHRLVNENNVDLEHNFMTEDEFGERMRQRHRANPAYAAVDALVNPPDKTPPITIPSSCGLPPRAAAGLLWRWLRKEPVYENIVHGGQHWRMDGLAFGGFELQPSSQRLLAALAEHRELLDRPTVVISVGVEGSSLKDDTLWVPEASEVEALRITSQYPHVQVQAGGRRNVVQWLQQRLPRCRAALRQSFPLQASRLAALGAMHAENVRYHHMLHRTCARFQLQGGGGRRSAAAPAQLRWSALAEDAEGLSSAHLERGRRPAATITECLMQARGAEAADGGKHDKEGGDGVPPACDLRELFALEEEQWRERAVLRGVLLACQAGRRLAATHRAPAGSADAK